MQIFSELIVLLCGSCAHLLCQGSSASILCCLVLLCGEVIAAWPWCSYPFHMPLTAELGAAAYLTHCTPLSSLSGS